jgi:DNA repair exonuclease SbcCD nuclease subunit
MSDSIRIAHFSDTHLGYRAFSKAATESGRNQRTIDIELAFERTITDIIRRQPDAIIHSGDVFHHSRPSWHAIRHFVRQMRRIEDAGIPALVIAGNHDTPRLRTDGSVYSVMELALPAIRFVADYLDDDEQTLFEHLNLRVQAIPHGALTNDDPVLPLVNRGKRNVLVSHGVVPGAMPEQAQGEPGEQRLDENLLDPEFDYIALGHYHVFSQAKTKAWYAGSTERFGFGDADVLPGYAMVTLGEPGSMPEIEHIDIPARPMLSLKPVYASLAPAREIADGILGQLEKLAEPEAMVSVALREFDRPLRREVESIPRRETPTLVWMIHFAADRQTLLTPGITREMVQTTDIRTLFAQFVTEKTGAPLGKEFATRFLERGDRALEEAIRTADASDAGEGGAS